MRIPYVRLLIFHLAMLVGLVSVAGGWHEKQPNPDSRRPAVRPNILWLTTEDIGPHLACYGDATARTPHIEQLAARGVVYEFAWSNYPVCAPARSTIICGMYADACGAGNMRSQVPLPQDVKMFPEYLREAGYYCTNNRKEDYNFLKPEQVWDESSGNAHWRGRAAGQPFFAVFNFTGTHESRIRTRPHQAVVDPAQVKLPGYWPDTPEVRQDWAQYYDNIQKLDQWVGDKLAELEGDGLTDQTIVVFFSDHGSGMPRHKRYAGDSGMRVPLIVYVPEQLKAFAPPDYTAGGRSKRLVSFVDLAPTMLNLVGAAIPGHFQGRAFLGRDIPPSPRYLFGFRDRMDERPDMSRSIRDERFLYIRNLMPHLPAGQDVHYQLITPTTAVWKRMFDAGRLNPVQQQFWKPRATEELYDLVADPEEATNLAGREEVSFKDVLNQFRLALNKNTVAIGDLGFIPEGELYEYSKSNSPRKLIGSPQYPLEEIFRVADTATRRDEGTVLQLVAAAKSENATIRYWAALGFQIRGEQIVQEHAELLNTLLSDSSPSVAIVAAEAMVQFTSGEHVNPALEKLLYYANHQNSNPFMGVQALNAIDRLNRKAETILDQVKDLPVSDGLKRGGGYLARLVPQILTSSDQ